LPRPDVRIVPIAIRQQFFDKAIMDGQPIETVPLPGPAEHQQQLTLDS
jgi:hypothetical protein